MTDHSAHDHSAMQHHDHHERHNSNAHGAHTDHTGHEQMFRQRFWVSLALTVPVLLFSPMIQDWFGFSMPEFTGDNLVGPAFAFIIFYYGGLPFVQMARPEIENRQPGMMTLITLAISVAFLYSLFAAISGESQGFFWEMATLIDVMLLGHWLEMRSVRQASGALDELAKLLPDTAERITEGGGTETVSATILRQGDRILVRPGGSVPADGEIVEGRSQLNEAMITGESQPVSKGEGDKVIAGTINGDGSLRVRITATGDDTALAGIMRLVRDAQQSKSSTQILADKAAGWLFYVALASAVVTAVAWVIADGFELDVIERVVTVLVIACPHALGLAIPLVVAISTALGARNGLLVRDRLALETAREIDTVIFDKTGTLTEGRMGVTGVAVAEGWDESRALALAAAVESDSEHPIARAIVRKAKDEGTDLPDVRSFEAIKGRGIKAIVDSKTIHVGGPNLLDMLDLTPPDALASFTESAANDGHAAVYLVADGAVVAAFSLADVIRAESKHAVDALHAMGKRVAMITGDSQAVADAVARELGIDTVLAEVLPEHKEREVSKLQNEGRKVAMVGDGVNDAPALARADVGIAIGSGTDVAVESAGIILVNSSPLDVVRVFALSRATYRKMIQNLLWATGYNIVAIPLAAGVLAPVGFVLSPAVGAAVMSASTVIVALNAQLLRGADLEPQPA
jgi:Cu2+-exporting ATPase